MKRLISIVVGLGLVLTLPAGALAAPPSNDLPGGAVALAGTVPQAFGQDTTEATVVGDDIGCGSGGLDLASVWYTFTPDADGRVVIDATESDYVVGINVYLGAPSPDTLWGCLQDRILVDVEAGSTWTIMFADIDDNDVNGGQLSVSIEEAPPPIDVTLTIDPSAKVSRETGAAVLTGTLTCSAEATEGVFFEVSLEQRVGRRIIRAGGFNEGGTCGPEPTDWSVEAVPDNGLLAGGKATGTVFVAACDPLQCGELEQAYTVRLHR